MVLQHFALQWHRWDEEIYSLISREKIYNLMSLLHSIPTTIGMQVLHNFSLVAYGHIFIQ